MKTIIQSVKGTRDFYPEEMALRSWLYESLKKVSQDFGYQEYDGPFLEKIDLYAAKSGEELVKEQAFVFQDRGGSEITLRPELTPTLARMVAQQQNALTFPLRWWSFGPFWRYERPQKGRTREFFQWNIDLIGANSPEADAELISVGITFFQRIGLSPQQVKILVNNRRLMDLVLSELGIIGEKRSSAVRLIDRRDKMSPQEWEVYALEMGLSSEQFEGLKVILADKDLWKRSPELVRLFEMLEAMGLKEYVTFDPQIIRGLDYYTGTVFEARDMDREGRAILGGGRYDNLVSDVGGNPLPGVGFAMGDVMASLVLQKYGCVPPLKSLKANVLMTVFDESLMPVSFAIANHLRQQGLPVVCYPESIKLQKQFKYGDRIGSRVVLVVGPEEVAAGKVTVKDLTAHTQEMVTQEDLAEKIKNILA
jgi:histidyl-tRNA synthetase